ncbi:MAG: hypothetical protein P9X24_10310 [Candidatus Hatepunaea meridiana]|nr:hypothetical protein [Candidatus Hatepunaea meridiana]
MKLKSSLITILILLILFILSSSPIIAIADDKDKGKLDEFEKALEDTTRKGKKKTTKASKENDTITDDSIAGQLFLHASLFVFRLYTYFPGEKEAFYNGDLFSVKFQKYPYASGKDGLMTFDEGKFYSIDISTNYLYESADLNGVGFKLRFSPITFFNFTYQVTRLHEETNGANDRLTISDFHLNYYRFRFPEFTMWWGLGSKLISGDNDYSGFSYNHGFEWYLHTPISVHYNYKASNINTVFVSDHTFNLNYHWKPYFMYLGYQSYNAGSVSIKGCSIGVGFFY